MNAGGDSLLQPFRFAADNHKLSRV
jgi:hypothetical protein